MNFSKLYIALLLGLVFIAPITNSVFAEKQERRNGIFSLQRGQEHFSLNGEKAIVHHYSDAGSLSLTVAYWSHSYGMWKIEFDHAEVLDTNVQVSFSFYGQGDGSIDFSKQATQTLSQSYKYNFKAKNILLTDKLNRHAAPNWAIGLGIYDALQNKEIWQKEIVDLMEEVQSHH